ncbi:MAG: DUF362 domain-containing protein [bacterium]|nr:DUF362 domain-containing protein [bacterium]
MNMNRRDFSKTVLASTVGLGASLYLPGMIASVEKESIVAVARSGSLKRVGNLVKKTAAAEYLNRVMKQITAAPSPPAAWKSLFSANETVAIKLSCLPGMPLSSSKGLVMAVVDGLRSAGVKEENIYIWERTGRELKNAGFKLSHVGVNIVGTDYYSNAGYSSNIEISGSVGTCFSKIMESADAVISVPVLKDHDIAGVSISMKNFYGAIYNPNKFHGNRCDPYVADLCNHPIIKNKLRLTVCDATRVQVNNGPAFYPKYAWEYGGLLVSRDPAALDYVGWQIIEERRKAIGLKSLKAVDREPTYIQSAAKLKLGRADMNDIKKIEI